MATGTIKGVKVGTANVIVNYGGETCNLDGNVNVVNITTTSGGSTQVGSTLSFTRTTTLQSVAYESGGPSTEYYVVGGSYETTYPTLTATYTVTGHGSTTIYYTGFKNKPTVNSVTGFSVTVTDTIASPTHVGSITIATTDTGASALSGSLTISDGSYSIKTITLSSAAVTLSTSVTATGYTADTSDILTISGNTLTAAKVGTTTLNATYGGKSCDLTGTHYVGTISAPSSSIQRTRTLSSITASGGSDNVSVLVGATANYTKPDKITASYTINATSASTTGTYSGFGADITLVSSNAFVLKVTMDATNGKYTLTSKGIPAGTSNITATCNSKTIRGFSKSVQVTNPEKEVDITDYASAGVTFTSSDSSVMTVS